MTYNVNNHPAVVQRREKNEAAALGFARDMKNMNKGTQIGQNMKAVILRSLKANYHLSTHEARRIYAVAK